MGRIVMMRMMLDVDLKHKLNTYTNAKEKLVTSSFFFDAV